MASTYTSNSGVEKPGIGDQSGEWGTTVNTNMDILDRAINGVGVITLSGTTHTLTTTDGALSDGQYKVLVLSGSPSGTNTITISPNDQDKLYFVVNSSGQTATFSQGSGANVSVVNGDTKIIYADGAGSGAAVTEFASEVDALEGITAGTVSASKAVIVDANKDITGFRNVTLTGELDAGSLDVSGNADIDGTLEADAMTLNGTAITTTATLSTGISNTNVPVFTTGVADDDFLRVAGTSIEGRSASEVLSDIGGQASLTFGISNTNAVKIDSASVADDEYARFTANGLESRSTSEVLSDIGASAAAGSSSILTVGNLDAGAITSNFGNINNGSSTLTTGALTASSGAIPALTTVTSINSGPLGGRRNAVFNPNGAVNQRHGTAANTTINTYGPDRWRSYGGALAFSWYTKSDAGEGDGYYMRFQRDASNSQTNLTGIAQGLETKDSKHFAGQEITFSFRARAGANWSPSSGRLAAVVQGGEGTDQSPVSMTNTDTIIGINADMSAGSDWATFSGSGTVPSDKTQLAILLQFTPTGTAGANDYFDVRNIQVEIGGTATTFEQKTYGEELALCQRYCFVARPPTNTALATGFARTTTTVHCVKAFPVTMRTTPSLAFSSATDFQVQYLGSVATTTAMAASELGPDTMAFQASVGSGLTAGQGMYVRDLNGGATITAAAEL